MPHRERGQPTVGDADREPGRADRDADEADVGREVDQRRAPTAARGRRTGLDGQPELAEPGDLGADRRPRDLEQVGELGLGQRALVAQLGEQPGLHRALGPTRQGMRHARILARRAGRRVGASAAGRDPAGRPRHRTPGDRPRSGAAGRRGRAGRGRRSRRSRRRTAGPAGRAARRRAAPCRPGRRARRADHDDPLGAGGAHGAHQPGEPGADLGVGAVPVVEAALDDDAGRRRATTAGARSANETRPHGEASALNPEPEKPATCTRPGSRDGHDRDRLGQPEPGRPRVADHDDALTAAGDLRGAGHRVGAELLAPASSPPALGDGVDRGSTPAPRTRAASAASHRPELAPRKCAERERASPHGSFGWFWTSPGTSHD